METPNVTIHSAQDAPAPVPTSIHPPGTVIDSKGRKIVARPIDTLEEYRLAKIMGEAGDSGWARSIAIQAASVREIDGESEPFPNSDREIEAMVQRLGTEGFEAAAKAVADYNKAKSKPNKDAAKN